LAQEPRALRGNYFPEVATMAFGRGKYTYEVVEGWGKLPAGWSFGWIPAVAVDSRDRVYVYSRSEHPMVVFDRDGNFLTAWGEDVLKDAHGLFIDRNDILWCVERDTHCVHKMTTEGKLLMTIGIPGVPGEDGKPFRKPTDIAFSSTGEIFISDGYGNSRIHKYSPDGTLLKSWGRPGTGPGEFNLPHGVRVDRHDRVLVCDRENNRIQIFNTEGEYQTEWRGFLQPDFLYIGPDDTLYVAELQQRVTVLSPEGERLADWGGGVKSTKPGEFLACPHGIWGDSRGDLYVGEVQADGRLQKFARRSVSG
jgi:DNA-binding beta-propeller fold protein YncE